MSDHGPHSHACAGAVNGTCHCDCHGRQHGVTHLAGSMTHRTAQLETRHVPGPGGGHYQVTRRSTGLPPGGGTRAERQAHHADQVTVRGTDTPPPPARPRLSAATVTHVESVRESLPKDQAGWDALVPTQAGKSTRQRYLDRAAEYEQMARGDQAHADRLMEQHLANMREAGAPTAEINRARKARNVLAVQNAERSAASNLRLAASVRADAEHADDYQPAPVPALPRDANGAMVPTEAHNAHLRQVLDVGHKALADARTAFAADPVWQQTQADLTEFGRRGAAGAADILDRYPRHPLGGRAAIQQAQRQRESQILRDMIAEHRPMGGEHSHTIRVADHAAEAALVPGGHGVHGDLPTNHREQIAEAEQHYPADWVRASAARGPLHVVGARRAYYEDRRGVLALHAGEDVPYRGGFSGYDAEVATHELGHRMEKTIPGLTALEWAFVRHRSPNERPVHMGAGYMGGEVAYPDQWVRAYAGKTYEGSSLDTPDRNPWEVFQVGMQDLFSRQDEFTNHYDYELEAFTLGALLTLG